MVTTGNEFAVAGAWVRDVIIPMERKIDETFDPIIKAAHAAHKQALSKKAEVLQPVELAKQTVKRAMGAYSAEIERQRREEAEAARREAQRIAEEKALAAAQAAQNRGDMEAADRALEAPPTVVVKIESQVERQPEVKGVSTRKTFRFEIIDPESIRREFLMPDEVKIGKLVRTMGKGAESMVGGIRVIEDVTVAIGSGK